MTNKPISEVIEEAKLSAMVLEYISQFEASEIESDDVDLRFEIDGLDTGCDVSITDQCGKASGNITRLIDHIAALEQQLAAERAISSDLRESMAAIHNTIRMDGVSTSLGALLSASKAAYDKSRIPVEGEWLMKTLKCVKDEAGFWSVGDEYRASYASGGNACIGDDTDPDAGWIAIRNFRESDESPQIYSVHGCDGEVEFIEVEGE